MARSVTLQTISDRARFMADVRESSFVSDDEMLSIINDVYTELYDEMVSSYGENWFASTSTLSLTPGTTSYALPADFYKLIAADFSTSANGSYVTLKPYTEMERNRSLTSSSAIPSGTVRLRYVPAPTTFTSFSDTVDGVSGWDRLITLAVAIDIGDAEETDTGPLKQKYSRMLTRISEMSKNRDQSMPGRVSDIYYSNIINTYGALQYRLYGGNIEFVSTEFLGADTFPPLF